MLTEAIARYLAGYLEKNNRFAKTIVFCVDQEYAEEMRKALNNEHTDLVKDYPDYACRVVSDEGQIGRGHLMKLEVVIHEAEEGGYWAEVPAMGPAQPSSILDKAFKGEL